MSTRKRLATADFETDPFLYNRMPAIFACGFYSAKGYDYIWGDDHELIVQWLLEKCDTFNGYVYMHNGGKFDFRFLIPYLPTEAKIFIIHGRIVSIKWNKVELRDSYAILPESLKKIGGKKEIDITKLEKENRETHKEEILEYLYYDNYALYIAVKEFLETYGNGLTLAGRAFDQMKKCGIEPHVLKNNTFDKVFRDFYYGGRVECFESGIIEKPLIQLDIKSAYPYAMTFKHFWGYGFSDGMGKPTSVKPQGFYTVEAISKGALPTHDEKGSLCFPNESRTRVYSVTGWEILAGIETGTLKITRWLQWFEPHNMIDFSPFVMKFYKQKLCYEKTGNSLKRLFAKLMMNSGYGRFALNPTNFKEYCLTGIHEKKNKEEGWEVCELVYECGLIMWQRPTPEYEHKYYNVATAASITGFVRAYLWKAITQCEGVLYCDTDSITCSKANGLTLGENLGEWECEAKGNYMAIGGKKMYAFLKNDGEWKTASKGVRLTPDEIIEVASGGEVTKYIDAPSFGVRHGNKKGFSADYSDNQTAQFISRKIRKTC